MIIIREFHLLQSVILEPKVITGTGGHTEICHKIENYEVTRLSGISSQG